jgi:hypothetical protein
VGSAKDYLQEWGEYAEYAVLKDLPEPSPFPLDTLPSQCKRLVEEASAAIGCPSEFVGLPMLVMLGCAIGNARRVKLKEGWTEGATLYAAVVADPGEKKSPAYKAATEAVVKVQAAMRSEYREEKEEYARRCREYEVKRKQAAKDNEPAEEPPQEPVMKRALVEDTTTEALAAVLEGNPRGVLVTRDELAAWKRSMDQYRPGGKGSDRQFWLSTWSNSYVSVDRKGRSEPLVLPTPFVGVFGSIQPAVLSDLGGDREDGLLDRFLFAYPETTLSRWTDDEISDGARGGVKWLYERLRALEMQEDEHGDPEPYFVTISPEAKPVFVELLNNHREEMDAPGFPARLRGPWAKLEAYFARLALIFSLCRSVSNNARERIEHEDVLRASILLHYFKNHARRVYVGLYGEHQEDRLVADVATFLLKRKGEPWEGTPTDFYEELESDYKPSRPEDLTRILERSAKNTHSLHFERLKPQNIVNEKGTRTKQRLVRASLNSAYSAYSEEVS